MFVSDASEELLNVVGEVKSQERASQLVGSDDFLQLLSIFLGFRFRRIGGKPEGTDIFHVQEGHRWLLHLVGHKHAKYLISVCDLIRDPFYVLDFQDLSLSLPSQLSLGLILKFP